MKVTGFIVDPSNVIVGATTAEGMDVLFEAGDCVPRADIMLHAVRLAGRYLPANVELPEGFAKVLGQTHTTIP